nr:MAG TPA: Integrase [Caudoviricetes sp.]
MAKRKRMRLPNGFGSVVKLSGKRRRRPYMARKTEGFDPETGYPIYKILGYFETYAEAYEFLSDYNRRPDETIGKMKTFADVYAAWMQEYTTTPVKGKLPSESAIRGYRSAFEIYARPLHTLPMQDVTAVRMQEIVTACQYGISVQTKIKKLFSQMSKYAIRAGWIQQSQAGLVRTTKSDDVERNPFTPDEVREIWSMDPSPWRDYVLVLLYTGMRSGEPLDPDIDISHLGEGYIIAGLKTDAGRDRVIPIHSDIQDIAEGFFTNRRYSYRTYMLHFSELFPDHVPTDCRRAFISRAQECKMDPVASHKITGHVMKDIHYDVYAHLQTSYLQSEMEKLHW